jgi:2-polyprenyl-6-hydroxyphenyl methylase/3-demethylubiquinone-9 3-methyltransferase
LTIADLHQTESDNPVAYKCTTAEEFARNHEEKFDVVTCLELLEHLPDPTTVIAACARMCNPGGQIYFSTLNRTAKAWLYAVVGAEYVLGMLPRGTHDYARFIRPAELASTARASGLQLDDIKGIIYNPLTKTYRLGNDVRINYLMRFSRPATT